MREILFRGKTQEHTRWIYGDLNHYMCDNGVFIAENGHSMHRVLKKTVGQYTGLTDKNGKKIFEGDVMRNAGNVVEFCNDGFCINGDSPLCFWTGTEIIGNVHDNPELLKGGANK